MTGKGSAELARHNAGMRLSASRAILAKCCDCQKNYVEGKEDCKTPACPLYSWQPYGSAPRAKSQKKAEQGRKRFANKENIIAKATSKKAANKRNKK